MLLVSSTGIPTAAAAFASASVLRFTAAFGAECIHSMVPTW